MVVQAQSAPAAHGRRSRSLRWGAAIAGGVLLLAACSDNGDDAEAEAEAQEAIAEAEAAAEAAVEEAEAEVAEIQADLDAANGTIEQGEANLAETTQALTTATEERDQAITDLQLAEQQLAETEELLAEIQTIAGQFPITVESSLIPDDMPGVYDITFQEAYCDPGFVLCGQIPSQNVAEIYFDGPNLRMRVAGVFDAGLFALDSSLYGIVDSEQPLQSCAGNPRTARITITMFAGTVTINDDGTRVINDVNASINVDGAFESAECPGGIQFFASTLTPRT